MKNMKPKTVLVTGAARGLGLELVRHHLQRGDHVAAWVRSSGPALEALRSASPQLLVMQADISRTVQVRQAADTLKQHWQQLDILYNNAGIYRAADLADLAETDFDQLSSMYEINAVGALRVAQQMLPLLHDGSVILNVSSEAGSLGQCWRKSEYAYAMSKAALNMGSLILSRAVKEQGIRVFVVHPGYLKTEMGGPGATDDTAERAACLAQITLNPQKIPADRIYIDHLGQPLPW